MTVFFADTSAIAKRYLSMEIGSVWVKQLARRSSGNIIVISELAAVEMFSLLARRQRENTLSTTLAQRVRRAFLSHVKTDYLVVMLDSPLLVQSRRLFNKYPLRTLDAIQCASALRARTLLNMPITFLSADNNLLVVASAQGFATDNPNAHP